MRWSHFVIQVDLEPVATASASLNLGLQACTTTSNKAVGFAVEGNTAAGGDSHGGVW